MEKTKAYLKTWMIDYLKNRDLIFNKIIKVDESPEDCDVLVEFKDKRTKIFSMPNFQDISSILKKENADTDITIATISSKENFDFLAKNWDSLLALKKMTIYFINPFSKLDKKWIIHPYTHSRITEKSALKLGLKSMYDTVEPTSLIEIENILKD